MPATARKLTISDTLVDINEATAQELREALPGIGDILARRIVMYRDEFGPFEHVDDLMRVPGLNGKRLSKFAPRISMTPPTSGYRLPAVSAEANGSPSDEFIQPMPIFSIASEPLPMQQAPSFMSLMGNGPEESMGGSQAASTRPSARPSARPSTPEGDYQVGGSLMAGPRDSMAAAPSLSRRPESMQVAAVDDDILGIPMNRPARVAVILAAIGLFSAILGATLGIQSQNDTPRARVTEQRVGRVESNVNDLAGTVRSLEGQASSFASSINALDARLTAQTHSVPREPQRLAPPVVAPPVVATPQATVVADGPVAAPESRGAATRRRVRQAMRELDTIAPAQPRTP